MIQHLILLIGQYGLVLVFANVLVEQLGLPLPAIPTLVIAGALSSEGTLSAAAVLAVAWVACMIGDVAWYVAGRIYGNRVLKFLCRISISPDSCVSQAETHFERWGAGMLVAAKFIPGLSTVLPPLAGATRLGWPSFLLFNGIGAGIWAGISIGAGMMLRPQVEHLLANLETLGTFGVALIGALLAGYIAFKWWERQRLFRMLRMARISVDELRSMMDAGAPPVILDVRSGPARQLDPRVIPGALPFDAHAADLNLKHPLPEREIVLYCTCPNEAGAAQAARLLIDRGYTRVRPLHGGFDAWIAAGHATE